MSPAIKCPAMQSASFRLKSAYDAPPDLANHHGQLRQRIQKVVFAIEHAFLQVGCCALRDCILLCMRAHPHRCTRTLCSALTSILYASRDASSRNSATVHARVTCPFVPVWAGIVRRRPTTPALMAASSRHRHCYSRKSPSGSLPPLASPPVRTTSASTPDRAPACPTGLPPARAHMLAPREPAFLHQAPDNHPQGFARQDPSCRASGIYNIYQSLRIIIAGLCPAARILSGNSGQLDQLARLRPVRAVAGTGRGRH